MGLSAPSSPPRSFADIFDRGSGETFPTHLLKECSTGLCLFAAGFYGMHDAYWMAEAGLTVTCVDLDEERLDVMRGIYSAGWEFVNDDAFEYTDRADRKWDIVTADPWSSGFADVASQPDLFCSHAVRAVVLGAGLDTRKMNAPAGWRVTDVRRRSMHLGGVFWVVLEPDSE